MKITVFSSFLHRDEQLWLNLLTAASDEDRRLLEQAAAALPLVADVTRSDVFLLAPLADEEIGVVVHARPHSMATLYPDSPTGNRYTVADRPWLWTAVRSDQHWTRVEPEVPQQRPEIGQEVWPIVGGDRRSLAAMVVYTNVIERERHRRRDPAFQRALHRLLQMAAAGQLAGVEVVPPFEEHDGILFVDHLAQYRYLSGQANNVYRRLGYLDDLRGRSLDEVAAGDLELVQKAWQSQQCEFAEGDVRGHTVQRSAIPLLGPPDLTLWERLQMRRRDANRHGALVIVKDVTEEIAQERELKVKAVMLKEVHHRVKNNLQMLVSIMRMQARRAFTEEARSLLYESINRILSMSAIHESLSEGEDQVLNLSDVVQRMMRHLQQSAVGPARDIRLLVEDSDDVHLPTNKATACALVINELVLNALKHGFREDVSGRVVVSVHDLGNSVEIRVMDNGHGLPKEFSLESETSLGLDIIRTLVQDDLKGSFDLIPRPESGAQAVVRFPKVTSGGPL